MRDGGIQFDLDTTVSAFEIILSPTGDMTCIQYDVDGKILATEPIIDLNTLDQKIRTIV
jgi:hypothetical protein